MNKEKKGAVFQIDVFCTILFGVLAMWSGFPIFILLFIIGMLVGMFVAVSEQK